MNEAELRYSNIDDAINFVFSLSKDDFYESGVKVANKKTGRTVNGYLDALNSFNKLYPNRDFKSITPRVVKEYKNTISKTHKPSTVHTYLRRLDTIWNELDDGENPFKGIRPRLQGTEDKYLSDQDVSKIKNTCTIPSYLYKNHSKEVLNTNRDYWLLMFYLGGIDMFDLAKLRYDKNVINGRIEFRRGKGNSGVFCSNKLFPETIEILDRYKCSPYLVPIYKHKSYSNFVRNFVKRFPKSVVDLDLTRRPLTKSARYTFINRAKNLLIDERIAKQIVGHSENSVHSIYSGRFPVEVIDEAHKKIITL